MKVIESDWRSEVEKEALKFVSKFNDSFHSHFVSGRKKIPLPMTSENFDYVVNIFVDTAIGALVHNACAFAPPSKTVEDAIVEGFRYKFSEMRKRSLGEKREVTNLEK